MSEITEPVTVVPSLSRKILGMNFGHTLAMDEHINKVIGVCYTDLCTLKRIGFISLVLKLGTAIPLGTKWLQISDKSSH